MSMAVDMEGGIASYVGAAGATAGAAAGSVAANAAAIDGAAILFFEWILSSHKRRRLPILGEK